jgi:anti-sigma regulatory factor (Ser/Thr protein kinase)
MKDLSLHILDIVENAIEAGARKVRIFVEENVKKNILFIKIEDDGIGMDKKTATEVLDPFFTTKRSKNVGLGLPMLAQSAREAEGDLRIESEKGKGTTIIAEFKYDHIDRRPLGNLVDTLLAIIATTGQEVEIFYEHKKNDKSFAFDTIDIRKGLNGIPLNNARILNYIRKSMIQGLKDIGTLT